MKDFRNILLRKVHVKRGEQTKGGKTKGGRGCREKHLPYSTFVLLSRLHCALYERTKHVVLLTQLDVIHDQPEKICNPKSSYY